MSVLEIFILKTPKIEPNPKLKEGDRIILIHMDGEEIPIGSKGIVVGINGQPRFRPRWQK